MSDDDSLSPDVFSFKSLDSANHTVPAIRFPFFSTYLSSGWPVAYLIAAVVLGMGALIGAFTYVSQPLQVAHHPSSSNPQSLTSNPSSVVGQITGMIGCQWVQSPVSRVQRSALEPRLSSLVSLGDTFALRSGLVEITYRTGAKVILQGPMTYVVDATNGGFINIGRLTGIMEVADAKGFTLRTPTAVVTDLGTEFGVEVDKEGSTTSHVFRGAVDLRPINRDKNTDAVGTVLRANESARIERASDDSHRIVVQRVVVKSADFVRRLQDMPSVDVLAWFRMGEDEPNARAGEPADKEIHSRGRKYLRLERHGAPTYSTDTEAPGSSLAMTFHGGNDGECFSSPRFSFIPNDYFILEAWAKIHKVGSGTKIVVASGKPGSGGNGYSLAVVEDRWFGVLEGVGWIDSGVVCEIGKWTHLALVCERGKSRIWVNGQPARDVLNAVPNMPDGLFVIASEAGYPERVFNGEIDEVRLSTFIAPFRPEMLLLRKAEPSK
jgi:hypothetical protein